MPEVRPTTDTGNTPMNGTINTEPTISVGRIVHLYVHRGLEKYGPIAAVVVAITERNEVELKPMPGTTDAWLVNDIEVVTNRPGRDPDQTIRQQVTWEWPVKN